ncbi:anoctamin-4 isoform X2 [Leptinotarsa decemlineata]|uniref:anoctamin-4 isoform X2 n=1 Tax=Leptinotarsa decemlineata TaxID=7539 RepID=UPI003D303F32
MQNSQGCYFKRDNTKRVDYVLVFDRENFVNLETYIHNLEGIGLEFEVAQGITVNKDFILIHIPQKALEHFGKVFDVGREEGKQNLNLKRYFSFEALQTPLSYYQDSRKRGEFVSSERIILINKLLESTKYGRDEDQRGLSKLMKLGTINSAYPLHEGPLIFGPSDVVNANNRQLLHHYWANFQFWYKEIPLDMIEMYFGSEVAFYFGWLEFFNMMLVPAAIFGVLVFFSSVLMLVIRDHSRVMETCSATNMYLCPTCSTGNLCKFLKTVSDYCSYAKWDFVSDNYSTVIFSIFMSIWATFFINLWRRRSNILKLRWEIKFETTEIHARQEYLDRFQTRKFNYITGRLEPYFPGYIRAARLILSISMCTFMIVLVLAAGLSINTLKMTLKSSLMDVAYFKHHSKTISMCFGCILQVIFIKIFGSIYGKLSIWLTDFENPRTQKQYDNSVLYKRYLLSFANNYAALFYVAFFRGRLSSTPGTIVSMPVITKDSCTPLTCVVDLCTLLFFLIIFKRMFGNILALILPPAKQFLKRTLKLKYWNETEDLHDLPQYEEEYKLLPTNRYLLTSEFCEMVIEFGFITFFVASFPLGPLLSLIKNVIEMRLDAHKLVVRYRRPIPRVVAGIGAWDGVLLGLTYLSTVTNAFVIAFTSDFVAREVYRYKHNGSLVGFVNSTLSEYATKDFHVYNEQGSAPVDICYYRAMRQPPTTADKYEFTSDYWMDVTWRLISILIFEHIVWVGNAILSYAIPDVPKSVKDQLSIDRQLAKEAKMKLMNTEFRKDIMEFLVNVETLA